MTRKDYVLLAQALRECYPAMDTKQKPMDTWTEIVIKLGDKLKSDNIKFDKFKFTNACIGK